MKKILLILCIALTAFACSKSNDPAPNAAASVQGNYTLTRLKYDAVGTADDYDYTLPLTAGTTKISGVMRVTPGSSDTKIELVVVLSITGKADDPSDFGEFDLRKSGSSYDILTGTDKVGTINSSSITIDFTESGERYLLVGKK